MEGPISFWGYKEQESNLILPEHDDDEMVKKYIHIFNSNISVAHKIVDGTFGLLNNMFVISVGRICYKEWTVNSIVKVSHFPHKLIRILEGLFPEVGETFAANQSACSSSSDGDNGRQRVLRTQFCNIAQLHLCLSLRLEEQLHVIWVRQIQFKILVWVLN
jgi:hypothetical protein